MRELRNGYASRGYGWLATFGGALLLLAFGFGVGLLTGSLFEEPDLVARQLSGEARELPLPPPEPAAEAAPAAAAPEPAPTPARVGEAAPGDSSDPEAAEFDGGQEEAVAPRAPARAKTAPEPARPAPESTEVATPPSSERVAAAPSAPTVAPAREAERARPEPAREEPPEVSSRGPGGFAVQVGAFSDRAAAQKLVGSLRGDRFAAYVVEGAPGEGARFRVRVGPFSTRDEASAQAGRLKERRKLPTWVIREGGP